MEQICKTNPKEMTTYLKNLLYDVAKLSLAMIHDAVKGNVLAKRRSKSRITSVESNDVHGDYVWNSSTLNGPDLSSSSLVAFQRV